jgi:hypothetical protein
MRAARGADVAAATGTAAEPFSGDGRVANRSSRDIGGNVNLKLQNPNSKEISNSKHQVGDIPPSFLGGYLEFGVWDLVVSTLRSCAPGDDAFLRSSGEINGQ